MVPSVVESSVVTSSFVCGESQRTRVRLMRCRLPARDALLSLGLLRVRMAHILQLLLGYRAPLLRTKLKRPPFFFFFFSARLKQSHQ